MNNDTIKSLKFPKWPLAMLISVFIIQFAYYAAIYSEKPGPEKPDLVVVYGGFTTSTQHGLDLARQFNCPVYFSESVQTVRSFIDPIADRNLSITIDPRARTTDQNARYAAPYIRSGGYKRVALVTFWAHEPRALFLTRMSLLFTGPREIKPYPDWPTPGRFWMYRDFWVQFIKLWGSLLRVGLHCFGVDNWPSHS